MPYYAEDHDWASSDLWTRVRGEHTRTLLG